MPNIQGNGPRLDAAREEVMARVSQYEDHKEAILVAISKASLAHSRPPTVRALASEFDVGVATMHSYLTRLAEEGMVEWSKGQHRSLKATQQGFRTPS